MPFYGGQVTYPVPFASARVVLRLAGPWPAPVVSSTLSRLVSQPRLTLRARTQADITVRVERREQATWRLMVEQTGPEFSFLVKSQGKPVRVWVQGDTPGWVELIETRG